MNPNSHEHTPASKADISRSVEAISSIALRLDEIEREIHLRWSRQHKDLMRALSWIIGLLGGIAITLLVAAYHLR